MKEVKESHKSKLGDDGGGARPPRHSTEPSLSLRRFTALKTTPLLQARTLTTVTAAEMAAATARGTVRGRMTRPPRPLRRRCLQLLIGARSRAGAPRVTSRAGLRQRL